jgi:phage-related protein
MTMSLKHKPLAWLHGAIQSPPFSVAARIEAGFLLRQLQAGHKLGLPHSRPMPAIGKNCHELRINDATTTWRVFYAIEPAAIVILDVVTKKTEKTPSAALDRCSNRIAEFRRLSHE